MKTTYSDMIAKLDNINYVGKAHKTERRINSVYELVINNSVQHTEYSNNESAALRACRYRYSIIARRIERLAEDDFTAFDYLKGAYIRKTDRDGNISKIIL